VDREKVKALLNDVASGALAPDDAFRQLRNLPVADLGFARLDLHRSLRHGSPEAIFCPGKTPEQVVAIARQLAMHHENVLPTRADWPRSRPSRPARSPPPSPAGPHA
jgi:pyridinium-3,5-biscarboxylic acid mononucleotide synthase